jgi:DNA-binding IclR family transcriptional regulator
LIVSNISSSKSLGPKVVRGTRWTIPMSPTARLILAYSSDHIRERVLARRSERSTGQELAFDANDMRRTMETIRSQFYEYDADAHDAGFATVTVPIFDHSEDLQAALTVVMTSGGDAKTTRSEDIRYLRPLKETALEISRTLGSVEMAKKLAAKI